MKRLSARTRRHGRTIRLALGGVLAAAAMSGLSGCWWAFVELSEVTAAPAAPFAGPALPVITVAAFAQKHGPSVRFENRSSVPLRVRYWVGKTDVTAPGGVADIRSRADMAASIPPGESATTQCGRSGWVTANSDAVIRVQIVAEPSGPAGDQSDPAPGGVSPAPPAAAGASWYELKLPAPFLIRATEDESGRLVFASAGGGALVPLQPDLWIDDANGELPVVRRP